MNANNGEPPSQPFRTGHHAQFLALLPEYATVRVLEQPVSAEWHPLEHHLARCEDCQREFQALIELLQHAYAPSEHVVVAPPAPNLPFLKPTAPSIGSNGQHERRPQRGPQPAPAPGKPARRFQFQFSAALVPQMRVTMVARSQTLRLLYSYELPRSTEDDPTVLIEVYAPDDTAPTGTARLCVEYPDRSPFNQAGSTVTLHDSGEPRSAITDTKGIVTFTDVLICQIEHWHVTVEQPSA